MEYLRKKYPCLYVIARNFFLGHTAIPLIKVCSKISSFKFAIPQDVKILLTNIQQRMTYSYNNH